MTSNMANKSAADNMMPEVLTKLKAFFEMEKVQGKPTCLSNIMDRMQLATGIEQTKIRRILKKSGKSVSRNASNKINLDDFDRKAILRKVHDFYRRKEFPTLDKLLIVVKQDLNFCGGRTSLWRVLKSMGFKFKKQDGRKFLVERPEIVFQRHQYLRKLKKIRKAKPPSNIIYLDETWINTSHSNSKCWVDSKGVGGFPTPLGKGKRLIIVHAGSSEGFVKEAKLSFVAKSDTGDYHNEMNSKHFEEWMLNKVFPNIPPNSVIIMDNASYHSVKSEKIPTSNSLKSEMQEWLNKNNISYSKSLKKPELYNIIKMYKPRNIKYRIDNLAKQHGHEILRLPPYHCDLNPEELIWANIKKYVANHNKNFNMTTIQQLFDDALNQISQDDWKSAIRHVEDIEKSYWKNDNICDIEIDQILIKLGEQSETESEISNGED